MLFRFLSAVSLIAVLGLPQWASAQDLNSDRGKLSYAIGWDVGADIATREGEIDVEAVVAAIRDAAAKREPQVTREEMLAKLQEFNDKINQERLEAFQQLAEDNKVKSETYLSDQRNKTNVVSLPSGVLYRVIEEGSGPRPSLEDVVTLNYRGSKMNGREFDSTFAKGVPGKFKISGIGLKGWQEVIPLMRVGATWQVWIPPELAFGVNGQPPYIGPNEALSFDLELMEINQE